MSERFFGPNGCFDLTSSSKEEIKKSFELLTEEVCLKIENLKKVVEPDWDNFIVPFYNTQILIDEFGSRLIAVYVYSISNSDYQNAYQEIFSDFAELEIELVSSSELIEKVFSLTSSSEYLLYDQEQKKYLQSILNKAKNQGTLSDQNLKQAILEINRDISKWAEVFNSNIQKATLAAGIVVRDSKDLADLPQDWVARASEHFNAHFKSDESTPESGPWYISLTSGVYTPFMEYSRNRALKKEIYSQKRTIASQGEYDNTEAILNLITKRKELANLRGFKDFLENSLEFTTATSVQLDQLCNSLTVPLRREQEQLHGIFRNIAFKDGIQFLEPWDIALYDRLYKEALGFNKEEIAEYFPYHDTKRAIFKLFEDCFSIQIKNATAEVNSWNADVEFYWVIDCDGTELGGFYIDPYQRVGEKIVGTQNIGAFCATLRESTLINGQNIRPIGILSFGFPVPTQESPSFCQLEELAFFFHEFGHLLAVLLKKQSQKTISPSFHLENDTVEFESMMLECWAQVPYILKRISKHYKTGEPLSDSKIEMLKSFLRNETNERAQGLLAISHISLALYSAFDPLKEDLQFVVNKITNEIFAAPLFEEDKFVWGCTPLFTLNGYLANTYMYLWAMTVAHTYLMEIESKGWNDDSIKKFGQTLKTTLYHYAAIGQPMHALKMATGKDSPDFEGFAMSRISHQ
ncbi:MAG: M3 family metallopeptidase [Bdellovibrio sp.]